MAQDMLTIFWGYKTDYNSNMYHQNQQGIEEKRKFSLRGKNRKNSYMSRVWKKNNDHCSSWVSAIQELLAVLNWL
jgi:hypothetical protein